MYIDVIMCYMKVVFFNKPTTHYLGFVEEILNRFCCSFLERLDFKTNNKQCQGLGDL